ncbi:MAG: hypothetical protein NVV74_09035 [Magnetospirillum sp.]|nr:hypothetical protein [Magnetospirillum sp.]
MSTDLVDQGNALLMQRDQLNKAEGVLGAANAALDGIASRLRNNQDDLDALYALAEEMLEGGFIAPGGKAEAGDLVLVIEEVEVEVRSAPIPSLDFIDIEVGDDWASYFAKVQGYADRNGLTLSEDPFASLLSPTQRIALEKRIRDEFSLKNANCDKFDYMIAGTCGFVGGLIDIFFVGLPGQGGVDQVHGRRHRRLRSEVRAGLRLERTSRGQRPDGKRHCVPREKLQGELRPSTWRGRRWLVRYEHQEPSHQKLGSLT